MTNADDRVFGSEEITSIGQQTYDKYTLLHHLPSVFINQVGSPELQLGKLSRFCMILSSIYQHKNTVKLEKLLAMD